MRVLSLLAMIIAQTLSVLSAEYHVAKNGSQTNNGTESSPFLTIANAAEVAEAGDIVYVHEGTYRETLQPQNAGTDGNPITFTVFDNDEVIISGTNKIESWSHEGDNIYKADVTMPLGVEENALFYNSKVMDIARWPNNIDNDLYTPDYKFVTSGDGSHIVYDDGILDIDWSGGYMWYLGGHSGASWTREITSSTATQVNYTTVDITKWPFDPHNPTVKRNDQYGIFYLFGVKEALDYQREWYYDATEEEVFFKAPNGENPSNGIVEYTARTEAVNLSKAYVIVDGFTIMGAKVKLRDNTTLRNCKVQYGAVRIDDLANTSAQIYSASVMLIGSNILVEKNVIEYGSTNGILITSGNSATNNTIQNNIVRYFNTIGNHSSPIRSGAVGSKILNNTIYTTGRDGIYSSGTDCEIAYNDVSDCMRMNNDGGIFYTVGNENRKNSTIHHNWFHDSQGPDYADGRVAGIYLDNNSKGWDVYNNVVSNITWSGIQINWDNWYLKIYNNTLWGVEEGMGRWENGYTLDDVEVINNYTSIEPWISTTASNNITDENSPFVDAAANDFRPKSGSSLIDAGAVLAGYTDGFKDASPDVGAYEFGGTNWKAGADWSDEIIPIEQEIAIKDFSSKMAPSLTIPVTLTYTVDGEKDIVVLLKDTNGSLLASVRETVTDSGEITVTLTLDELPEAKEGYTLDYDVRPVGSDVDEVEINGTTVTFTIIPSSAVTMETYNSELITIYPNPVCDYFTVSSDITGEVVLANIAGKVIKKLKRGKNDTELLQNGIYFVLLIEEENVKSVHPIYIK